MNIYIDPPINQGFGWTVDCDAEGCGYDERMLSEEGAGALAKEHAATHKPIIIKTKEAA